MKKILCIALSFSLAVILFVGTMIFLSQSTFFYVFEFNRLGVIEQAGIEETPETIAVVFTDYFSEKIEEFQMEAEVEGEKRLLYNEREQLHMADVKKLIEDGSRVSLAALAIFVAVYIFLSIRKNYKDLRFFVKSGIIIYYILLAGLIAVMVVNFSEGFRLFHEILFNNDLWLLNQSKDYLLMLMPQRLYIDMLIYSFVLSNVLVVFLGVITWKVTAKRKARRLFY